MKTFTQQDVDQVRQMSIMAKATDVECINHLMRYERTQTLVFTPNELAILKQAIHDYEPDVGEVSCVVSLRFMLSL